jgi:hypothetical protein
MQKALSFSGAIKKRLKTSITGSLIRTWITKRDFLKYPFAIEASFVLKHTFFPSIGKTNAKAFSVFVFSVTTNLAFNNVYNYNYSVNGQNKVAITPLSKRFIYLGYFVSLGIDRTQDEINNHL